MGCTAPSKVTKIDFKVDCLKKKKKKKKKEEEEEKEEDEQKCKISVSHCSGVFFVLKGLSGYKSTRRVHVCV